MQPRTTRALMLSTVALTLVVLMQPVSARAAGREKVLHEFGDEPFDHSGLIFDSAGNLYGTTYDGGVGKHCWTGSSGGCGTVFELTPNAGGGWTEKLLYSFLGGTLGDGQHPAAGLIFDAAGNLYGTTAQGGGGSGGGTVFELTPGANGQWIETILYTFGNSQEDGLEPWGNVIFDAAGNLYGTTKGGGVYGWGTVFELTLGADGWTETLLYSFDNTNGTGVFPYSGVVFDASGNLYGTTSAGAAYGTVYELSPPQTQGGAWTQTTIHAFQGGSDGAGPLYGNLIFDTKGNLYGTTQYGGKGKMGTVFELSPGTNGMWRESRLFAFRANGEDGGLPIAGLVFDVRGNVYGTTAIGGNGFGTVFRLTPSSGGKWAETFLHAFPANGKGELPDSALVLDSEGNLYGTTKGGGFRHGAGGVAFEITP